MMEIKEKHTKCALWKYQGNEIHYLPTVQVTWGVYYVRSSLLAAHSSYDAGLLRKMSIDNARGVKVTALTQ